jgi:catechol 2,3-dioxygenase
MRESWRRLRRTGRGVEEESMNVIRPAMHHATMRTSHLDEMVAWYVQVIGARVTFRNEHAAWTTNDEANHRVAFLAVPGLSDDAQKVNHNGLHHLAFEYASFEDLMSSYKRLAEEGMSPAFCLDHGMTVSIYYRDPEANYVELQCDCFGDWKQSCRWMETSADFQANPIGVFFDPAKVYEAHRSGTDSGALHEAMRGGKYLPERIPNIGLPE